MLILNVCQHKIFKKLSSSGILRKLLKAFEVVILEKTQNIQSQAKT